MADFSGLVGRLPGCRIVDLRARRLALALLGGRPTLEGGFARRGSGSRRACRRRVVSASSPHRTACKSDIWASASSLGSSHSVSMGGNLARFGLIDRGVSD